MKKQPEKPNALGVASGFSDHFYYCYFPDNYRFHKKKYIVVFSDNDSQNKRAKTDALQRNIGVLFRRIQVFFRGQCA